MTMVLERLAFYSLSFFLLIQLNCAIPVMPTGGPVDSEPPVILEASPSSESVNVDAEAVRLVFSEYIDQASLVQALTITPEFDTPLVYRWRKTRVDITFPEPLRENTTYILTLDTNLRDVNRVALKEPITIAFATGPTINRGKIAGKVIEDRNGDGVSNLDIYAYALEDTTSIDVLPEKPAYRTQTGENGSFNFDFMSEQAYYVIALRDGNRNRKPDPNEAFAVPPTLSILADTSASVIESPWLVTLLDTLPPSVQRVRSLSRSRFGIRFSESIQLLSPSTENWILQDSTTQERKPVRGLYLYPEDPRQIYLIADSLENRLHFLIPDNIADSSGNALSRDTLRFTPSTGPDTLQTRFLGFAPQSTRTPEGALQLAPGQEPSIRFNQPVPQVTLDEFVIASDTSGATYSFQASTTNGSSYALGMDSTFPTSSPLRLTIQGEMVNQPDTSFTELFAFSTPETLGEISGVIQAADTSGTPVIEIFRASQRPTSDRPIQAVPDADGNFKYSGLVDKTPYNLRAFLDLNSNQRWDGGQILPYLPSEAIVWYRDSLQVRARWEQSLSDTLYIPVR